MSRLNGDFDMVRELLVKRAAHQLGKKPGSNTFFKLEHWESEYNKTYKKAKLFQQAMMALAKEGLKNPIKQLLDQFKSEAKSGQVAKNTAAKEKARKKFDLKDYQLDLFKDDNSSMENLGILRDPRLKRKFRQSIQDTLYSTDRVDKEYEINLIEDLSVSSDRDSLDRSPRMGGGASLDGDWKVERGSPTPGQISKMGRYIENKLNLQPSMDFNEDSKVKKLEFDLGGTGRDYE